MPHIHSPVQMWSFASALSSLHHMAKLWYQHTITQNIYFQNMLWAHSFFFLPLIMQITSFCDFLNIHTLTLNHFVTPPVLECC